MKRIVALLLACAFVMGALAAPAMAAKTVVIKIAGMKPEGEPETIGMHKFGQYLKELSGGKYEVQVFPNSTLARKMPTSPAPVRASSRCVPRVPRLRPCILPWPCWKPPMLYDSYDHAPPRHGRRDLQADQ